jgi:hypothetical protein
VLDSINRVGDHNESHEHQSKYIKPFHCMRSFD